MGSAGIFEATGTATGQARVEAVLEAVLRGDPDAPWRTPLDRARDAVRATPAPATDALDPLAGLAAALAIALSIDERAR